MTMTTQDSGLVSGGRRQRRNIRVRMLRQTNAQIQVEVDGEKITSRERVRAGDEVLMDVAEARILGVVPGTLELVEDTQKRGPGRPRKADAE